MLVPALALLPLSLITLVAAQDAPTLQTEKTEFPSSWFYTDANCSSGDWSKNFGFHKNKNNKCRVINDRRALLVYPDPQPDANPTKGCIFLYQSDNCSENKDKKHYENVDAFEVEYTSGANCYQFANDEKYYNSFIATTMGCDTWRLNPYNFFDALGVTPYDMS